MRTHRLQLMIAAFCGALIMAALMGFNAVAKSPVKGSSCANPYEVHLTHDGEGVKGDTHELHMRVRINRDLDPNRVLATITVDRVSPHDFACGVKVTMHGGSPIILRAHAFAASSCSGTLPALHVCFGPRGGVIQFWNDFQHYGVDFQAFAARLPPRG